MPTTKVNKVNVEKAVATSKANATISFNELFKTTKKNKRTIKNVFRTKNRNL